MQQQIRINKIIFTSSVAIYGFAEAETDEKENQIISMIMVGQNSAEEIYKNGNQKIKQCTLSLLGHSHIRRRK